MVRILLAEDDDSMREYLARALERTGYGVTACESGIVALDHLKLGSFDLLLTDIVMPELDGIEVCRKLRAEGAVPILFLSSRDDELDRVLGLELGADDYVTKPFSPRELAARVKALLRRAAAPSEPGAAPLQRGDLVLDVPRHKCFWRDARSP